MCRLCTSNNATKVITNIIVLEQYLVGSDHLPLEIEIGHSPSEVESYQLKKRFKVSLLTDNTRCAMYQNN